MAAVWCAVRSGLLRVVVLSHSLCCFASLLVVICRFLDVVRGPPTHTGPAVAVTQCAPGRCADVGQAQQGVKGGGRPFSEPRVLRGSLRRPAVSSVAQFVCTCFLSLWQWRPAAQHTLFLCHVLRCVHTPVATRCVLVWFGLVDTSSLFCVKQRCCFTREGAVLPNAAQRVVC